MTAEPNPEPFACALCTRFTGPRATHMICESGAVLHTDCAGKRGAHAKVYPDCPVRGHDLWSHKLVHGSRDGARLWLHTSQWGAS